MSNRLATQTSPYLLQHADNPVDWYPWGDDAFDRAKVEDKPVMLSIGYSACHWCHVMEAESFANAQTAALLNERVISVKVDREERPDVDQIYQLVVQLMGRGGGWPLTVFLTPARRPFFAGTYFPPQERHGLPSFPMVIEAIHDAWSSRRDELESTAAELTQEIMRASRAPSERGEIPPDAAQRAADAMITRFDETHGGFGSRPKFPNTMALEVLLRSDDVAHVARAEHAMRSMRRGGIWDHLGGGFHRYSTDERWLVPHFEKMLYDNALLMRLAAQLHRATGREEHAQTARGIATWLEREMTDAQGAFYAAQDADSEGAEGRFFVWRVAQLREVLGASDGEFAARVFGVSARGNFSEPGAAAPAEGDGASVLSAARDADEVATELERSERGEVILERVREALRASREERPRPFRDEKVLATWNGLMIGALAEAAMALGDDALAERALRALRAIRSRLWNEDERGGHLLRVYKDGVAHVRAFLDDHGDLAGAAIDVHEATGDAEALAFAQALVDAALRDHWDDERGSLTYARRDAPDLIAMSEDAIDNAVPSGASSMAHALLRLASHRSEARYEAIAGRVLHVHAERALRHPLGYGHLVGAMDRWVRGPTEIVIVAEAQDPAGHALARVAGRAHVPNRVLVRVAPSDAQAIAARWGALRFDEQGAAAFVCRNRTCSLPVREPEALRTLLAETR